MTRLFDCILEHPHVGVCETRYGTCFFKALSFPPTRRANTVRRSSERTMQLFGLPTTKVEFNGLLLDVTPTDAERHPITVPGQTKHMTWGGQLVAITSTDEGW